MAVYGKYIVAGYNWHNINTVLSATLRGYFVAVNKLFRAQNFAESVNFDDAGNVAHIIFHNLKVEEDVANQRAPITNEMYVELIRQAKLAGDGSELWLLAKCATLAKVIGPRACEFAQKTMSSVEKHVYPSGKKVVKAFIREDFCFFD